MGSTFKIPRICVLRLSVLLFSVFVTIDVHTDALQQSQLLKGAEFDKHILDPAMALEQSKVVDSDDTTSEQPWLNTLVELSPTRRAGTLFRNKQSIFQGVQHHFVNTSTGKVTFLRRDLVSLAAVPIVVQRVYDTSKAMDSAVSPGWFWSYGEKISLTDEDDFIWTKANAERVHLILDGDRFTAKHPVLLNGIDIERGREAIQVNYLNDSVKKRFVRHGHVYRLEEITTRTGQVNFEYLNGSLHRVTSGTAWVEFSRDTAGRIISVEDSTGAHISYHYEGSRLDRFTDRGGNTWNYTYSEQGALTGMALGASQPLLTIAYDAYHRVTHLSYLGVQDNYRYASGETLHRDALGRESRFQYNKAGVTTNISNRAGVVTELHLDEHEQPLALSIHGEVEEREIRFDTDDTGAIKSIRDDIDGAELLQVTINDRGTSVTGVETSLTVARERNRTLMTRISQDQTSSEVVILDNGGRILTYQDGKSQELTLGYTPEGALSQIARGDILIGFQYNDRGLLTQLFKGGIPRTYRYNKLGFRTELSYGGQLTTEFDYGTTGNLVQLVTTEHDGKQTVQTIDRYPDGAIRQISVSNGRSLDVDYDDVGLPVRMLEQDSRTTSAQVDVAYDPIGRVVSVRKDGTLMWQHEYHPLEQNITIQRHGETVAKVRSGRWTENSGFSDRVSLYNRFIDRDHAGVYYDEHLMAFAPLLKPESYVRETNQVTGLKRMRVLNIDVDDDKVFQAASNPLFGPSEYDTIGCCAGGSFCFWFFGNCMCICGSGTCPPPPPPQCTIEISVTSPQNFFISATPSMPTINAQVTNLVPSDASVSWLLWVIAAPPSGCTSITIPGNGPFGVSPTLTGTGSQFTPLFPGFFGGELHVTGICSAPNYQDGSAFVNDKVIKGTEPSDSAIVLEMGSLTTPFQAADLRRIGCQESDLTQFSLTGSGRPFYGVVGDAGIMQICFQRQNYDLWNWRFNVQDGRTRLTGVMRASALNYMNDQVTTFGAPFTNDRWREEAIKRYNAGSGGSMHAYREWDGVKWVVVDRGGIPNYVPMVTGKSATCPP